MTTAYDFPDLNISPIFGEEESDNETAAQNLANVDVPIQDVLKGLSISESDPSRNLLSSDLSNGESGSGLERRLMWSYGNPRVVDSFDSSSEGAFAALECEMKRSLFSVAESCDIAADLQESFCSILNGCRVSVEMGCCTESSEDVRSRLRRMGAVVSRRFTETTTHVVFSSGGRAAILRRAFAAQKKPFLVDPRWVYECFHKRTRVPEEPYSLYDCRFLISALRRSLDARSAAENLELSHGDENDAHITTSILHANEAGPLTHSALPEVPVREKILRRRTHCAFPLEYRDPSCVAVQMKKMPYVEGSDELTLMSMLTQKIKGSKTVTGRLKPNSQNKLAIRGNDGGAETAASVRLTQKCLRPIENSSEMGGLLGFRAPSYGGAYGPLVETASSMINDLQLASTSEEFVKKKQFPTTAAKSRNGIVFTGFSRERERELNSTASELRLKVQAKITNRTYCVISANGDRTLNTLRAVVSGIPVVKLEWLDACADANKFLPLDRFYHEKWQNLIQKRAEYCRVFSGVGKIFVCDSCSPPTDDIVWMIRQSGGEVTSDPCECALVVAPHDHSLEILCSEDVEFPPPVVVEKYILDCICENEILEFDGYMEHDVVDEIY
ncbi:BRCA1 protein [Cooperia oncophora]